jgi:hypothetical protein
MLASARSRRLGLIGTLIVSALGLCAVALPSSPAKAQCLGVDLGFGCAGLGVGSWYTQPHYYGYPYYGYAYYGYPAYGYPAYGYPASSYPYYYYSPYYGHY